jgi:hypothetical protein
MSFSSPSAGFAFFHPRLHVFLYERHWLGTISGHWYDNAVGHYNSSARESKRLAKPAAINLLVN